jgi:hypothetical protein
MKVWELVAFRRVNWRKIAIALIDLLHGVLSAIACFRQLAGRTNAILRSRSLPAHGWGSKTPCDTRRDR